MGKAQVNLWDSRLGEAYSMTLCSSEMLLKLFYWVGGSPTWLGSVKLFE